MFLDEIGELDISLQPKLLRVLETREVQRVGGTRMIPVDVRVVVCDEPRPPSDGQRRHVSRRPLLPPECRPGRLAAAPRAHRRHPRARAPVPRGVGQARPPRGGRALHDYARRDAQAPGLPVARQRPRAEEHDRACRVASRSNRARHARPLARVAKDAAGGLPGRHRGAVRRQTRSRSKTPNRRSSMRSRRSTSRRFSTSTATTSAEAPAPRASLATTCASSPNAMVYGAKPTTPTTKIEPLRARPPIMEPMGGVAFLLIAAVAFGWPQPVAAETATGQIAAPAPSWAKSIEVVNDGAPVMLGPPQRITTPRHHRRGHAPRLHPQGVRGRLLDRRLVPDP